MSSDVERVKIPADFEVPDKVLAGLTAHQVAIIAGGAVLAWMLHSLGGRHLPLPIFGALAVPIMACAAALALIRRDGLALDALLLAAWRQSRSPRYVVYAPDGVAEPPSWGMPPQSEPPMTPAPLWLPVRGIRSDGAIDLGNDGVAALVACTTVSFALRTAAEQQALVGGFARWLNSLSTSVQLVITAERIDLGPQINALRQQAPSLPHPALEQASLDHARYLAHLASTRNLLRRRVLLVMREPGTDDADGAAVRVLRRAEDAVRALAAASVSARVLGAEEVTAVLAAALDPAGPAGLTAQAPPDQIITWSPS